MIDWCYGLITLVGYTPLVLACIALLYFKNILWGIFFSWLFPTYRKIIS